MRAPKGIRPSPMDTGYDKVKNLDPSHQILVIYRPCMDLRDQSFSHQNHCTLGQRPRTGSRRRSAAQSNLAFLGMWRCSTRPDLAELLPFDADAGSSSNMVSSQPGVPLGLQSWAERSKNTIRRGASYFSMEETSDLRI